MTFKDLCGPGWSKRWDRAWEKEIHGWFVRGHCYALAIELANRHGWEVWVCDVHAVAKRPDGVLVDADGEHLGFGPLSRKWRNWDGWERTKASYKCFKDWNHFHDKNARRVRRWAKRLAGAVLHKGVK